MAWIDDRIWCHPKFADLPAPAFRAYINGIAYSSGFGTRGHLTNGQLRAISAEARVKRSLIKAGLWDAAKDGIDIHDWDEHNSKRDARREADRERKRIAREAAKSAGTSAGQSPGTSTGTSHGTSTVAAHVETVETVEGSEGSDFDLPALDSKAGLDFDSAREGLPPSQTLQERDPQDAPGVLLDALTDADQGTETILRNFRLPEYAYRQALEEVTQRGRSVKVAVTILKRIADEHRRPPTPANLDSEQQARTNVTPKDHVAAIRQAITNGAIPNLITLDAELRAANLNGDTADQLRALLPVTSSPDDDIPL